MGNLRPFLDQALDHTTEIITASCANSDKLLPPLLRQGKAALQAKQGDDPENFVKMKEQFGMILQALPPCSLFPTRLSSSSVVCYCRLAKCCCLTKL